MTGHINPQILKGLIQVALGKKKASWVISNIFLVNVFSREIQKNFSIGVFKNRIAYVGPDPRPLIGSQTEVIDGQGQYLLPGFLDAHTHLDSMFTCNSYAPYALMTGNTTAITEMGMVANVMGKTGIDLFMKEAGKSALRIFFLAPALAPPFPELETSQGPTLKEFSQILKRPEVLGVGEAYWPRVVGLDPRTTHAYLLAHRLNKTREGHAAGAKEENFMAYAAAGTNSCHEATTFEEAVERLRFGLAVMIREGFVRKELEALAPLAQTGLDLHRVMLVSDIFHPEDLLQGQGMNSLLAKAVSLGFDPVTAVMMVTRHVADYFGLRDLGGIAPGKLADLVLVKDLTRFECSKVWVDGCLTVDHGRFIKDAVPFSYPEEAKQSFSIPLIDPGVFSIPCSFQQVKVRVVKAVNQTITQEVQIILKSRRGRLVSDPKQDVLKMAVIQRHDRIPRPAFGFTQGVGLSEGAVATSLTWDANNILVIGVTDQEMAQAVNRLLELKGGWVVCRGDRIVAEMPMPIMGLISEEPLPALNRQIQKIEKAVQSLGSSLERPFLTLQIFCFTGLPFIRLTDKGLADIRQNKLIDIYAP